MILDVPGACLLAWYGDAGLLGSGVGQRFLRVADGLAFKAERSRDNQPLDIAGTFLELLQFGIAPPFFDEEFTRISPAAVREYGRIGHPTCVFGCGRSEERRVGKEWY